MRLGARWLASLREWSRHRQQPLPAPEIEIPQAVAARLIPDKNLCPVFPRLREFGDGEPGVTRETADCWIVRDDARRVVGGAYVRLTRDGHPPVLDVAVDPERLREGWASRLYRVLDDQGIDVEAASRAALAHRTMTAHGYAFMLGRRRRHDSSAEETIAATAHLCPKCGPVP
ncbi:MAG: hypothetical protein V1757_04665 [Actinomycetota bacterium]